MKKIQKESEKKQKEKRMVVVFAGPSGSGKDTIMNKIIEKSDKIVKLVTATTRKPREGEVDGKNYYFLSKEDFLKGIENKIIPEHNIHAFNYYGTYLPDLDKKIKDRKIIFSQIQLVGAKYLKENYNALLLFFEADSFEILEKRIRERSELKEDEIKERIKIAKKEVEEEAKFYDYIIKNKQGKLDETIEKVLKILKENNIEI